MPSSKRFLIVGLGLLGQSLAKELMRLGHEVLAVDQSEKMVDKMASHVTVAARCDVTDREALEQLNVQNMHYGVVCIGENLQAALLSTAHLLDLGVANVVARANDDTAASILKRIGAHYVFSVEDEVGKLLAQRINSPEGLENSQSKRT
jgi:trk system potassium uptake protein TrkA